MRPIQLFSLLVGACSAVALPAEVDNSPRALEISKPVEASVQEGSGLKYLAERGLLDWACIDFTRLLRIGRDNRRRFYLRTEDNVIEVDGATVTVVTRNVRPDRYVGVIIQNNSLWGGNIILSNYATPDETSRARETIRVPFHGDITRQCVRLSNLGGYWYVQREQPGSDSDFDIGGNSP
ncbi:hypothetical protein E4U42_002239 [Claviceps africana]|uniref:Uncharacterized protein n=1 Tax=Claviceps africana TaxID=83212 RepID=A0A8K0JEY6_9HYPO|nr:hypothetical protein E4U42_002239 [Claviceps africana]